MKFYLGTHCPSFVGIVNIPWFISVPTIVKRKSRITGDWVLDSGGFTQVGRHGEYIISESDYIKIIELQSPDFAFCQDWMCEDHIIKKTGKSVKEHQDLTIKSYFSLRSSSDKIRPVLQGWNPEDYQSHLKDYLSMHVDTDQVFGVGTICSRNGSPGKIKDILLAIHDILPGIKLHGFGVKTDSLIHNKNLLWSADSMAWSFDGRYKKICGSRCHRKNCANCMEYALLWRKNIIESIPP